MIKQLKKVGTGNALFLDKAILEWSDSKRAARSS